MQSSNPTLNSRVFQAGRTYGDGQVMTIQGTINKTLMLFFILLATACWGWSKAFDPSAKGMIIPLMYGSMFGGLIVGMMTSFKPNWAPVTAPLYAALEGVFVAIVSAFFEARYPGLVIQAVGLTLAVTGAMLLGYKAGWLQATPGLRKGLMIAMGGLFLFYMAVMIAGFFGIHAPGFINGRSPLGIAFSFVVVGIAAMSLILDFDLIEQGAKEGLAKYMEWYGGFALMVTVVWLYLELLRLLSKVSRRD